MGERGEWGQLRERRRGTPGVADAYDAARLATELGSAVRELRENRAWSQAQLAQTAGMTPAEVARVETGSTMPTLLMLKHLARALDADLAVQLRPHGAAPAPR
ncbi:Helix-turn-helix domain-containing protein [Micromonospora pattaloongensis]|uniref:Helix-turn-helix domain-containing protein n=1 Tax=Micromonospora pattaloongensis TaxID=405436 RepID=A0A1H3H163_9ACTN|nr:helix-turn-helix transcriptional regulator [Micromonospora pattaloongensis]SDY09201.1 Helix-turn-helix domain-containing protein [Micromonospora pattaloongensis]